MSAASFSFNRIRFPSVTHKKTPPQQHLPPAPRPRGLTSPGKCSIVLKNKRQIHFDVSSSSYYIYTRT